MLKLYVEISQVLEEAFRQIEALVAPPILYTRGAYPCFRYKDQSVEAAVIQKCARLISSLNASLILFRTGYFQELGAMIRILNEINEDILFLCQAIRTGEKTELHKKYLNAFYQEEFDNPDSAFLSTQNRPTVPRKKIHAAISRIPEQELNPSDNQELHRTLSQGYSGFVHGASTHIMDMYGGNPPRFHVSGMLNTPRTPEFIAGLWECFYGGLLTIMMISLSFKQDNMLRQLYSFRAYVETQSQCTEWEHPQVLIKNEKAKKTDKPTDDI